VDLGALKRYYRNVTQKLPSWPVNRRLTLLSWCLDLKRLIDIELPISNVSSYHRFIGSFSFLFLKACCFYRGLVRYGSSINSLLQFRIKIYKKSYHKHVLFLSTKLQSINKDVHIGFVCVIYGIYSGKGLTFCTWLLYHNPQILFKIVSFIVFL
jgi:hypothetical protein